ncbi:MAG: phenylalanine--tRNA ligase subunit alpha [Holosporaceae bacterium]|jgi:phenylalanyl-tRNA synthetase alpha chain|nr:phenylalanine--tRNA ligase subunit alpha [Holosporaceae bacterium]
MHEFDRLQASCLLEIEACDDLRKVDLIKNAVLGKNGRLSILLKDIKGMSDEKKRDIGSKVNSIKDVIMEQLAAKTKELEMAELEKKLASELLDVTLPSRLSSQGKLHPLAKVMEEVAVIMSSYGFSFADGPDVESEYYNFTTLNMPDHHPARTMHDTFYINASADEHGRKLLRTHTSPVQTRAMLAHKPPFRFFSIGRVFRSDYDATHTPMFNQVECLMVDDNVGFSNLKWFIMGFLRKFFDAPGLRLRFRPSFFPFTEPSAEVDLNYEVVNGKMVFGSGDKWLEIGGAGMVHPNVLRYGNVDPDRYQGFAFGCGLERMASLKYGIPDLRGYFESNERWRNTFGFNHAVRK